MTDNTKELYQPSNATIGDWFIGQWCAKCTKDNFDADGNGEGCEILLRTMIHSTDDPEYPTEWCYNSKGSPQCTAFVAKETAND